MPKLFLGRSEHQPEGSYTLSLLKEKIQSGQQVFDEMLQNLIYGDSLAADWLTLGFIRHLKEKGQDMFMLFNEKFNFESLNDIFNSDE